MGCIALILVAIAGYALSWAICIGIMYLIAMCFGLVWSLPIATGIWLVFVILKWVFAPNVTVKK